MEKNIFKIITYEIIEKQHHQKTGDAVLKNLII